MSTKFKQGIEVTGQVTATSFSGDGSALTGVSGGGSTTWANITDINNASGPDTIAIGTSSSAGAEAVSIGKNAGDSGDYSQAIGNNAGNTGQGVAAVALGSQSGETSQGDKAVAVGQYAGQTSQGGNAVAVGRNAGLTTQGANAVAIGWDAGKTSQGNFSVAIGINAGETSQSSGGVAIGSNTGWSGQGEGAVAIGNNTGHANQGIKAVAIGYLAGYAAQGESAIAIGHDAGLQDQAANSIVISATGVETNNTTANSLVIKPIRSASGTTTLMYDATTGEVTHTATPAQQTMIGSVQQISGPGSIDVTSYITEITTTGADHYTLADGVAGQIKIISMIAGGGVATITPTTLATGTTIIMADVNDNITLLYGTNGWVNTATQGSIIA